MSDWRVKTGVILNVNFNEKDIAKSLGARWSQLLKKWYVPEGPDLSLFERWLPDEDGMSYSYALGRLYLVQASERCWRCATATSVYCLASDGFESEGFFCENEFTTWGYLNKVPSFLNEHFGQHCPSYFHDYSKKAGGAYCMNHCECGAKLGDFYLHNEPGGGFFQVCEKQASNVLITGVPPFQLGRYLLDASPGRQFPNLIFEFGLRR